MNPTRPEYPVHLLVNGRVLKRVVIDPHYRERHAESISDELILKLVQDLDGKNFPIELSQGEFEYFTVEPVIYEEKPYRLVLLLCMTDEFLGVINAFRVNGP
jgi:hypothetical protein